MIVTYRGKPDSGRSARAMCVIFGCLAFIACVDATSTDSRTETPFPLPQGDGITEPRINGVVVSDAAPLRTIGGVSYASGEESYAWVSLQPGSVTNGVSITTRNRSSGSSFTSRLEDGGLDPVAILAEAGDTLDFDIAKRDGTHLQGTEAVRPRRPPVIVRTVPSRGKRDLPLNTRIVVVFSEPMDSSSLISEAVQLQLDGARVSGSLQFTAPDGIAIEFTPAADLESGRSYTVVVTSHARDLEGQTFETGWLSDFTTVEVVPLAQLTGKLAFASGWLGGPVWPQSIYTMNPDGTGTTRLGAGMDPSWSPDGRQIAFWRYDFHGLPATVYVMNADGSNVREVTAGYHPTWSPDGTKLAFGCGGICTTALDGSDRVVVTRPDISTTDVVCDSDPAWSPDGSTIAFTRWPECLSLSTVLEFPFDFWTEVMLVGTDGSNPRTARDAQGLPLTYAGWPAWSPNGMQLALYYLNDGEGIGVVNADGLGFRRVAERTTESPFMYPLVGGPDWSQDGKYLVLGGPYRWGLVDAAAFTDLAVRFPSSSPLGQSVIWSWSRGRDH